MGKSLSVRDVCERHEVAEHTVLIWIKSGELRAINVGRSPGGKKPRWRITEESLRAFEALRTSTPPPPPTRRKKLPDDLIKFY